MWQACSRAKCSDGEMQVLLKPTSDAIAALSAFRNAQPTNSTFFNHLSTVSESIGALGWVTIVSCFCFFI
jgi:hypothetical protein